jgi:hypothetical protein
MNRQTDRKQPLAQPGVLPVSPAFLIAAAVSALLGLIGGSAVYWLEQRSFSIYIAGLLWTLISAIGTGFGRCAGERLPRGAWRRCLWIAGVQTFPLVTVYLMIALALQPRAELFATIPIIYTCTLGVALFIALSWGFTSPYRTYDDTSYRTR